VVDPERAAQILAESQAAIERTRHIRSPAPTIQFEDRQTRFRREADEEDQERIIEKERTRSEESADRLNASVAKLQGLLEQYVEGRIQSEHKTILKIMAGSLGELVKRINKQQIEIDRLTGADKSKVVDLKRKQ
jgi:hypothetical protein